MERASTNVANIKSQIKRNRQNEAARQRNKAVRSELKTRIKRAEEATGEDAADLIRLAIRRIDQAASKGVLHRNTAARQTSRLAKRLTEI
jgi:small subunit ribosomal protein S20